MTASSTPQDLSLSLCAESLDPGSIWIVGSPSAQHHFPEQWTSRYESLPATSDHPPLVIQLDSLRPSQLPLLEKHAPALLVVSQTPPDAALEAALRQALPQLKVLGPDTALGINPKGYGIALALDPAQLEALSREARLRPRLQIAPTPDWLLPLLEDPNFAEQPIYGWVDTDALSIAWVRLLSREPGPPLLIALCGEAPDPASSRLDDPFEAQALAHLLSAPIGLDFDAHHESLAALVLSIHPNRNANPEQAEASHWPPERWQRLFAEAAKRYSASCDQPTPIETLGLQSFSPDVAHKVYRAQKSLERWRAWSEHPGREQLYDELDLAPDPDRSAEVIRDAAETLTDHESKVVLKGWGFEVTRQAVGKSASAALSYAQKLGYPVALKAISPSLRNKHEVGCVALDVETASSLKRHYQKINDQAIEVVGEEQFDGVLVSEMVPAGLDIHLRLIRSYGERDTAGVTGPWVVYARAVQGPERKALAPGAWGLLQGDSLCALRFADRVIPGELPEREAAVQDLAMELLRLHEQSQAQRHRLFCIELDPLRILLPDQRPPTVLDAHIEQDAHIQGA